MKNGLFFVLIAIFISGCAASFASKYDTKQNFDQFNNRTKVSMTGGVIDADYLGIISNGAEFNPYVIKGEDNKVVDLGIHFTMENISTSASASWLNVRESSTVIFLLNNGTDKVELKAVTGSIDYSVSAPQNRVYTTEYDQGFFIITPEQMRTIANATSVEVRVTGASSSIDFPRKPNNSIVKNFLPNIKKFYETEVSPFL